jgi:hypothetical protein
MTRRTRLFSALAVVLVLGACGQGGTDTPLSPSVPRMDGGGTSLGGNTVDPNGGSGGTNSTTTSTSAPQDSVGATTGGTSLGGN